MNDDDISDGERINAEFPDSQPVNAECLRGWLAEIVMELAERHARIAVLEAKVQALVAEKVQALAARSE